MATWWRARASQSPAGHGYSFLSVSASSAPGSERAAPPVFPGGIAGSAIPEPGRRSSRSCIRPAREVRPAAGSPGSRLLLLWVQPSLPPPLGRLWQSEAPVNSLVAAADAAEAAGRSQAAGRPAARSPGAAAAAAALAQPPRGAAESGVPLHGSERTETAGCSWARAWKVCACARERVWGRQSRIRAEERAGEPSTAPSAPPPVP